MKCKRLKMPGIKAVPPMFDPCEPFGPTGRPAIPMIELRDDLSHRGTRWQKWLAYKISRLETSSNGGDVYALR